MTTILVIDDEQSFLMAMNITLSSAGHEILTAQTGEDGLLLMSKKKPDLVILDIMMPGMGGLATLEAIKKNEKFKKIPVIVVSGVRPSLSKDEQRWDEFLTKPFTLNDILKLISKKLS